MVDGKIKEKENLQWSSVEKGQKNIPTRPVFGESFGFFWVPGGRNYGSFILCFIVVSLSFRFLFLQKPNENWSSLSLIVCLELFFLWSWLLGFDFAQQIQNLQLQRVYQVTCEAFFILISVRYRKEVLMVMVGWDLWFHSRHRRIFKIFFSFADVLHFLIDQVVNCSQLAVLIWTWLLGFGFLGSDWILPCHVTFIVKILQIFVLILLIGILSHKLLNQFTVIWSNWV